MKKTTIIAACIAMAAGAALAHQGVKNAAVKARMDNMTAISRATEVLGNMAKGKQPFETGKAQAAAQEIALLAGQISVLFEAEETDPKSEASPAIWQDFSGFETEAVKLATAAQDAANIADESDLRTALRSIGATCNACHKAYRISGD